MVGLIVKPELPSKDVDLSDDADINRYYYYICNGVDTIHAAGIDEKAVERILALVPKILRERYPDFSDNLMTEIKEGFTTHIKRAIVEFALTDYLEEHAKVVALTRGIEYRAEYEIWRLSRKFNKSYPSIS
jgi:dynein heavy chain